MVDVSSAHHGLSSAG